jgi:hypothetical protein
VAAAVRDHIDNEFAEIERRTERLIGYLRLAALVVLALVFWVGGLLEQGEAVMVPLSGLGLITLVGLALASSRLLQPWQSWLFATFDVLLLTHCRCSRISRTSRCTSR